MKYPDVNHWHPVVDWTKVKRSAAFLITKATQGTDYVDPTLYDFIKNCESKGIPYWVYTYLTKGNEKAQAQFMVKTCKSKVGKYFVGYIIDVEENNDASDVKAALTYINKLGVKTMIYTGYSQYNLYADVIKSRGKNCAWWEARYGKGTGVYSSKYPCHDGVDLHQFTSNGVCSGISGQCDLNRLTGTLPESWFTTPLPKKQTTTKKVSKVPTYKVGKTYKLQKELRVRTGAGTKYSYKKHKQLTVSGKKNDKDKDGLLDKGTVVTCLAVKKVGKDIWIKCPSGWLAAYFKESINIK